MTRRSESELAKSLVSHAKFLARLLDRVGQPTILMGVAAAVKLSELAHETLVELVVQARRMGYTWQQIGDVLGVTRQAAFQRFGQSEGPGGEPSDNS